MIADSPISILGTDPISVRDIIHPSRSYGKRMETGNHFDESDSWCINTSSYSRRGPVCGINRKLTMMRLLTKLGAQTLHAIMKLADHRISITMPTIGNVQGGQNYDSIIRKKEKNKPIM